MCGIVGVVAACQTNRVNEELLRKMCQTLRHRGPDDEGFYLDARAGLGMRRLSVIDLVSGHQPFTNEQKNVWLVFNGEIYNYKELRYALEREGHTFVSQSDTEVIVHAYEEYGDRCVDFLNGMFGFALWDSKRCRLLVARDRLGIKPLYYWAADDQLVFGSELKAILAHPNVTREIDLVALDHFLTLEYIPSPRTILKGISKLPPGHLLVYENGNVAVRAYWDVPLLALPEREEALVEQLRALIDDSVRLRLASDVPIGAFLSGGVDSSTIVARMTQFMTARVQTFCIGFQDQTYSELADARLVATHFNTLHRERVLEPNIAELSMNLVSHFDEPFADFSIFPTYLVSQLASESVKVVLTGDGGDEVFAGYDSYVAQDYDQYYRKLPQQIRQKLLPRIMEMIPPQPAKKGWVNKAKRFVEGGALPSELQHARWMTFMNDDARQRLYRPEFHAALDGETPDTHLAGYFRAFTAASALAQQQYVDVKTYLVDDILTKVDRMSMAVSLEARVPFLDHRVVEFALNLPPQQKLHRGKTKVILRKAMAGRLPERVLSKPKQGFSIPLKHWLRGSLRPMMLDLLAYETVNRRGYFAPQTVTHWIDEHLEGRANHSHRLWALMVFEIWYKQTFESNH